MIHPAYLAGFFDGEGWLTLQLRRRASHHRPHLVFQIGATQAEPNQTILQAIAAQYGGNLYPKALTSSLHSVRWDWRLSSQPAIHAFVSDVFPYLHVKRERALILLEAMLAPRSPITAVEFHEAMARHNQRGPKK